LQEADAKLQATDSAASSGEFEPFDGVKVTLSQQDRGELSSPTQRSESQPAPELPAPILAVQAYRANLAVLKTADRLSGTFLESFTVS
jgi:hypothetical protein